VNVLVAGVAVLLGFLLAMVVGVWAVVAVAVIDAVRRVATVVTAIAEEVRGRATVERGREVGDPVPVITSGDVLDHAHVGIGGVR
jgi:hypothetical protein